MIKRASSVMVLAGAMAICWVSDLPKETIASDFDFDDGTVQGWKLEGAIDPSLAQQVFPSNFVNGWSDISNYPSLPGLDPEGDDHGSLQLYTTGGHGIENPGGQWWIMQFVSPDFSSDPVWQEAVGYSVQIAESMAQGTTLYANLFVNVYDLDQERNRRFTNGNAVALVSGAWSYHLYEDWTEYVGFPSNYVVEEIFVDIWGEMAADMNLTGGVYLDEVEPIMPLLVYVDDDGGGPLEDGSSAHPFDEIQEGIYAAVTGKTVLVSDGTYIGSGNRDLNFQGKAIIVASENGPQNCVIDCQGSQSEEHRGFVFDDGETAASIVMGFTILNGYASDGAAIYCTGGSPTITNCVIRGGETSLNGAGIYFHDSSNATVRNCVFMNNTAGASGGAIFCWNSSPLIINCTMTDNSANGVGGAICGDHSSGPTLVNSVLWEDTAISGGPEIALTNSLSPSSLAVSHSDVQGGFGAAYVESGCLLEWDDNIEEDPCFGTDGYHLQQDSPCIDTGEPDYDYEDQTDIDGSPRVYGVTVDIGADEVGRIHNVTQDTHYCTIQEAIDAALNGDVIVVPEGTYTGPGNCHVYFRGKSITVRSESGPASCIIDCAETQSAAFYFNNDEGISSILEGFTITNGHNLQGGAIWCIRSSPTINNCAFERNTATDAGGAIYCSDGGPVITNCSFMGNSADWGAGIFCTVNSNPVISNCLFRHNSADWGGGIYCVSGSSPTLTNCILWENLSSREGPEIVVKSKYQPAALSVIHSIVRGGRDLAYVEANCTLDWGPGNLDVDPFLTPDGHLRSGSPCVGAGTGMSAPSQDRDGESRPYGSYFDIGIDEFIDIDTDRLPDWWETKYFGNAIAADPCADPDGDELSNLDEYELYSSSPIAPLYYVDAVYGSDAYDGLAAEPQGGGVGPRQTLQGGINAAGEGDTVLVAAGTYLGTGNKYVDFGGKAVVLHAPDGPGSTVIDGQGTWGRAFNFHNYEGPASAVVGFTIISGLRNYGGAIVCLDSHPQFRTCVIADNSANYQGSGLYCYMSIPTLADCVIENNHPEGIRTDGGGARITEVVEMASNDWVGQDILLSGDGVIQMHSDVRLDLDNAWIRCDLNGPGTLQTDLGAELTIEGNSHINLDSELLLNQGDQESWGLIQCDGLLQVNDQVQIEKAVIELTRANFRGNAIFSNNTINIGPQAPYGQFFIEDSVIMTENDIHSSGDRYMNFEPVAFSGLVANNRIHVTISEGIGQTRGGLLELRGQDLLAGSCPVDEFICVVDPCTIPQSDETTWTIEELTLEDGAKLDLTNRFDFQPPYETGGNEEVLYVRNVVLGEGAILNTAFNRLYCGSFVAGLNATVKNEPLLGFSASNIALDDDTEFAIRVTHNNYIDPEESTYDRIHVERLEGVAPDPQGMMLMQTLIDNDPASPEYLQVVSARAKGLFDKTGEDEVLVLFEYLFGPSEPDVELVVYLTDVPELLDHADPRRADHYLEVARVLAPPAGWPGSAGSDQFGRFQSYVPTGTLNFVKGMRVELELIGPDGTSLLINNWDPQIQCYQSYCKDLTGDTLVTVLDFLTVLTQYGQSALPSFDSQQNQVCLEGVFSENGYLDAADIVAWDWLLTNSIGNLCQIPLAGEMGASASTTLANTDWQADQPGDIYSSLGDLLMLGKRGATGGPTRLQDHLYVFDAAGLCMGDATLGLDRASRRLIQGPNGYLYQLHAERGLVHVEDAEDVIIPPGEITNFADPEPRYNSSATILVGLQGDELSWIGRPLSDVAFDQDGYAYVTPVVVDPNTGDGNSEPYTATAKLELKPGQTPPYEMVKLYDDPPLLGDNKEYNALVEVEVDDDGKVYVINSHNLNNSDVLWVYEAESGNVLQRLDLSDPNIPSLSIPGPIGLCAAESDSRLYLASSQNLPTADFTVVYGLSEEDLSLERSITINGMGHVTSISEDRDTGTLWVSGFAMRDIPDSIFQDQVPFYYPYLAEIPPELNSVEAKSLSELNDPNECDLALPLSIVWTGPGCGRTDINRSGKVDVTDLCLFAQHWLEKNCTATTLWCGHADMDRGSYVDLVDLSLLAQYWLENRCGSP